jgi:hypothetical protein
VSSKTLATKIPEDSRLHESFKQYRDERDMNNSQALRSLMRTQLRESDTDKQREKSDVPLVASVVLMGFALGWFLAGPLPSVAITLAAVAGYGGGTVLGPYIGAAIDNRRETAENVTQTEA